MRRKRPHARLLVATLLALPGAVAGRAETWTVTVDGAASELRFTLDATLHKVRGSLALTGGEILVHGGDGRLAGEITANAASAETGHAGRDRKMHAKVLESDRFAQIRFVLDRLRGELAIPGTSRVEILGELILHGDGHAVTVPAEVRIENGEIGAAGRFVVPYVEWGLDDPSNFLLRVAPTVEVEVSLRGSIAARAEE